MSAKTYAPREGEIERRWYVVDAADETLGRLASRVARVLEGKHKPTYAPNLDSGAHVITSTPRGSRSPGTSSSRRSTTATAAIPQGYKRRPSDSSSSVVPRRSSGGPSRGCCPHTRLGAQQLRKLKIYAGSDHPHQAQRPEPLA